VSCGFMVSVFMALLWLRGAGRRIGEEPPPLPDPDVRASGSHQGCP
jgi:hypothetical protein